MNFKKNLFSVLLIVALAVPSFASNLNFEDGTKSTKALKEIKTLVQDIEFDYATLDNQTVKVHFMINTSNEVVVLRTNKKEVDSAIKFGLNYKSLENRDLEINKVYILPIQFKAEGNI